MCSPAQADKGCRPLSAAVSVFNLLYHVRARTSIVILHNYAYEDFNIMKGGLFFAYQRSSPPVPMTNGAINLTKCVFEFPKDKKKLFQITPQQMANQ